MEPTSRPTGRATGGPRPSPWKRYGPLLGVAAVIAIVVVVLLVVGGGDDSSSTSSTTGGGAGGRGPVVLTDANRDSVDWGPTCDVARGTVAVPLTYAPPCVEPFGSDGDAANGGATAPGVTGDTITVALYQAQPDILEQTFFEQSGSDESLATEAETVQQYVEFFEAHYETYGRHVEIVPVKASGAPDDEEAAKADAIKVAEEVKAFASWGGPGQTAAYAEELAARGVMCLGDCMIAATDEFVRERDDTVWLTFASVDQLSEHWARFITRQLVGRKAAHAGDEAMRDETRVFGVVRFDESFAGLDQAGADFVRRLKGRGVRIAADSPYELDLARAQENARNVIAKLKAANVTTVIFAGDPVTPQSLTQEATAQEYFPEWVVLGAAYTDTSLFGRTYDQQQWRNAFGVSSLPVPLTPSEDQLSSILVWQSGRPPAAKTFKVLVQAPLIFYTGLHLAGPDLNPTTFRAGLFRFPSGRTNPTDIHLSWGDHGIWPRTDLFGTDDATLIWWNPDATGLDEVGNDGRGRWEYSQRGRRYLPDGWPEGPPDVFDPETSVTSYETPPPGARPPSYPSPTSSSGGAPGG